jgi:predicted dehydrogenase
VIAIALVGCGAIAEEVAHRVYAQPSGEYRIVAAVDARPDRAAAIGRLLDGPAYGSLDELSGVSYDALDIRLPHHLHADVGVGALSEGRHVLVEKPLATSLADARRLISAATESDRVAAVAENYPHLAAVRAAHSAIESGEIGTVRTVRTTRAYTLEGVWLRDGWRRGEGPSGGLLLDQGTHHASLLRQLAGEVDAVGAQAGPSGETVLVTTRFVSGLVAQSIYSWESQAIDGDTEATVFGSAGRIDIRVSYDSDAGGAIRYGAGTTQILSEAENYYDSHRLIIDDWVAAIAQHRSPVVTIEDAHRDLEVVLAARRSLEQNGRLVPLTELV